MIGRHILMCRQPNVDFDEMPLLIGQIDCIVDRPDRAFRYAHRAIDAVTGNNHQKIRALAETAHRTDFDAIGDDKGHGLALRRCGSACAS